MQQRAEVLHIMKRAKTCDTNPSNKRAKKEVETKREEKKKNVNFM